MCQKEKILSWHEWRKHRHSIKVNVKEAKRSKNSPSAQHYFASHKSSDLKMRPCCLWNSEAWLQATQTDQLTAFNKTTADLIIPQRKQEEKCSSLTTLSSSTPPRTAGFCTKACRKIRFLNHVNNNKEKLTLFCLISKEAFPSLTGGVALVPLSWAVSGVSLTPPQDGDSLPSWGPVPGLLPAPGEGVLPRIQPEPHGLQFGATAPCIACCC